MAYGKWSKKSGRGNYSKRPAGRRGGGKSYSTKNRRGSSSRYSGGRELRIVIESPAPSATRDTYGMVAAEPRKRAKF